MSFAELSRQQLAVLVPELLLTGHLIDRSAMAHVAGALGVEGIRDVSVDEWMGASPIYTRRMRRALGYDGDDVETIFKGLQLDIGAPPQFMDFRYTLHDRDHGEFHLDHCGALLDVEPMGEQLVTTMCHHIEDPTFDATASATNPRARMRPIHRPPRTPLDRQPHCAWTVTICDSNPPLPEPLQTRWTRDTRAATFAGVTAIDSTQPGRGDYRGPLVDDLAFAEWSHSALVRIAEEVCLQQHLLALAFAASVRTRLGEDDGRTLFRRAFTGIAGLAAERLLEVLDAPRDLAGLAAVLAVHPAFAPAGYAGLQVEAAVDVEAGEQTLRLRFDRAAPAQCDRAWPSLLDAAHLEPLQAILDAIRPALRPVVIVDSPAELVIDVRADGQPHEELVEVRITRLSRGAGFAFVDRGPSRPVLPLLH